MALGYRARRRWSLAILLVAMPLWIVAAVTVMNALDARYGRQPLLVELGVYAGLGLLWALPFRRVFLGVGRADPAAPPPDGPPPDAPPAPDARDR